MIQTVKEFGSASLELLAWELSTSETALGLVWELCLREQLLARTGEDPDTGETFYTLTPRGHQILT